VALIAFYGTDQISFAFDSSVTGTTHNYESTTALVREIRDARIYGGMHFRTSLLRGNELGVDVGRWVIEHKFQPR